MHKQNFKGRHTILSLSKCIGGPARLLDKVAVEYAKKLQEDEQVESFRCHVPLKSPMYILNDASYRECRMCSDFIIYFKDGHTGVRECAYTHTLKNNRVKSAMVLSKRYWEKLGIQDWAIITEEE